MIQHIRIKDPDDERVGAFTSLKDRELALRHGLFVVEGEWLVLRLLHSSYPVHAVLMTPSRFADPIWQFSAATTIYLAEEQVISRVVGFPFHRGMLALGIRSPLAPPDEFLRSAQMPARLIILPEINDAENLGALFRSGIGLGYTHFILGPSCTDPFSRRALRTSMGAIFQANIMRSQDLHSDIIHLRHEHGFKFHALTAGDNDAENLEGVRPSRRVGLIFGSEANGIAPHLEMLCDNKVTIPMQPGTDSLNVNAAAAIALYHYRIQQGSGSAP